MDAFEHLSQVERYLECQHETDILEIKSRFDPKSAQDCCEILKDFVAMANSGGGVIVIGLNNDRTASGFDLVPILSMDPADFLNKFRKYTSRDTHDFRIAKRTVDNIPVACLAIGGSRIPIVFTKPGTYEIPGSSQQKTAFGEGTIFFRHGAKSEHAGSGDLAMFVETEIERVRESWLANVRKVVEAPPGAHVFVVSGDAMEKKVASTSARLTTSPDAPLVRGLDPNTSHPYRQKELIATLNRKLGGAVVVTTHDILALRRKFHLEDKAEFCFQPKFSSLQYSESFIEWTIEQHRGNPLFFQEARDALRNPLHTEVSDQRLLWLKKYMREGELSTANAARGLRISQATLSRLFNGIYKGDVEGMLRKIERFRHIIESTT